MNELQQVSDKFTEIVGSHLHYFENVNKIDFNTCTAREIVDLQDGWVDRYRKDNIFKMRVMSMVAQLIQELPEPPNTPQQTDGE
jgi:hypothetical protein